MSAIQEDLLKESADADRRGDGWTSDVCERAAAEIERLTRENAELRDRVAWLENPTYQSVPGKRREGKG